jgi:hypothetical protein
MVGFILTGLLATVASAISSTLSSMRKTNTNQNPDPRWIVRVFQWCLKALSPAEADNPHEFWAPILESFVLSLSDQQLLTGLLLAILATAKYFPTDKMSFTIAGDLVFFSIITHFATMKAIKRMLRENFKLAVVRIILVSITLVWWLFVNIASTWFFLVPEASSDVEPTNGPSMYFETIFLIGLLSSLLEVSGILWAYWDNCLSLFLEEKTLEARKAITKVEPTTDQKKLIQEWIDLSYGDQRLSTSALSYFTSALRKPLTWLFRRFCLVYITTNSAILRKFQWGLAEIVFPFRFGLFVQVILMMFGLLNVSFIWVTFGLENAWGFGQLLPAIMVFAPFFSLPEMYSRKFLVLPHQKA